MDIEKIIREYIDKSLHLSLATAANNKPWVCEVHFVYDDQLITVKNWYAFGKFGGDQNLKHKLAWNGRKKG